MTHLTPEFLEALAREEALPRPWPSDETPHAHLEKCAECRARLASARARVKLLGGMTPYTLSPMAFRRVEARAVEAAQAPRTSWWVWALGGVAAAAALAFVVARAPAREVIELPKVAELPRVAFTPLTVIRASDDAQVRSGAGSWQKLTAGATLREGDALSGTSVTMSAEQLKLQTSGELALGGAATLTLGAGAAVADVSTTTVLQAGTRRFSSSDSLFSVTRAAAELALDVARGEVEVFDSATGERRVVKAPASLRWSDGALAPREEPPRALTPPDVTVPVPELTLETEAPKPVLLPEKRDVDPDPKALASVRDEILRQRPKFSACYEKWLKTNPSAQGEVTLELQLNAHGRVLRARVEGSSVSAAAQQCLTTTAKTLVLSPLGAEATLQVPLVLRNE